MTLPNFTANITIASEPNRAIAEHFQTTSCVVPMILFDGWVASCGGDDDCNSMFDSDICGNLAYCSGSGDDTFCACLRF